MPNHVTNIITITGAKANELMDLLIDEGGEATFNNVLPMPSELDGTRSPSVVVSQSEYDKAITNRKIKEDGGEKFLPSLPITKEIQKDLLSKYGSDNWYDWCALNWGTKWGIYRGHRTGENQLICESAWCSPFEGLLKLSEMYPTVEINIKYADEDFGQNVGEYTIVDNDVIYENIPKSGSEAAITMALDITGDEYYLTEYLDEVYDADEFDVEVTHNDFVGVLLNVIYAKRFVPCGDFVCEHLKQRAIYNEDYEYAKLLNEELKEIN